jgi:hypothetical protein
MKIMRDMFTFNLIFSLDFNFNFTNCTIISTRFRNSIRKDFGNKGRRSIFFATNNEFTIIFIIFRISISQSFRWQCYATLWSFIRYHFIFPFFFDLLFHLQQVLTHQPIDFFL